VAVDGSGNVYIADYLNHAVKEMPAGCASSSCVSTLGGGFNNPTGVAVDGSGNVYVADFNNNAVKEMPAGCASSSCVSTLGGGFSSPYGVAVDSSGNVYAAEYTNNAVKELNYATAPSLTFASTNPGSSSAAQTTTLTNDGNASLTLSGFTSTSSSFSLTGSSCTSSTTLTAGSNCSISATFTPQSAGTSTGDVNITDNNLNVPGALQQIGLSGTGLAVAPTTAAVSAVEAQVGSTAGITVTATESGTLGVVSGSLVTFGTSGSVGGSFNPTTCTLNSGVCSTTYTPSGTLALGTYANDITASFAANIYTAANATSTLTVVTGPVEPVGTASATQTITLLISAAGTTNSTQATGIPVLTQGAAGLDFGYVSGGTCATSTAYTVGQTCTVKYTFTPTRPWARYGGITLVGTVGGVANSVMAQAFITGTGTGPQTIFSPAATTSTLGGGFLNPRGVAVDGSGNVYVADSNNSLVKKMSAGCVSSSCVSTLGGSFQNTWGVAVDGSGNLYFSDINEVYEMVAVDGSIPASPTIIPLSGGFGNAYGMAVDGSGNVYVAYAGDSVVHKIPAGCTTSGCVSTLGGGFKSPEGVTVDSSGNIYVGDIGNKAVYEMPAGCASSSCVSTLGGGFSYPAGVAVDGSGNVYVADTLNDAVKEMPAGCASSSCVSTLASGFSLPAGVAVDSSGNVFVADTNNSAVKETVRATAPSLTFVSSQTLSNILQTVTLTNDGNADLTLSGFTSTSSSFSLTGSGCSTSTTLTAGGNCSMVVTFTPQNIGTSAGNINITDNTLNVPGTLQQIGLSGTAVAVATPTFSLAAGTYVAPQTIKISDSATGATIYYTTNGTTPTTGSTVYSGPITLSSIATIQLEAIATIDGYSPSAVGTATYTLINPTPVISGTSPMYTTAGGTVFTLTVNGSGFLSSSTVFWGASALVTQYVSATQLTAQVPATDIAYVGAFAITVQSPAPGGGTSNAWQFQVDSSSTTGTTAPTVGSTTATVTAGSTASYPVTVPPTNTIVTVVCLNLPVGAACSYSPTTNIVTITTSSTTPKGTYAIVIVFTETVTSGAFLLPILLLPLAFLRRKLAARRVWLTACLGLVLMSTAVLITSCASSGGSGSVIPQPVTSSSPVTLTVK